MKKGLAIVVTAVAAAAVWNTVLKTKRTAEKADRAEQDLCALSKRVDGLEEGVDLLDVRTDSMEYDMKYNAGRSSDFSLYDVDVD